MFHLTTRNDQDFCDFILGYKMVGDSGTSVLYCGDLPEGRTIPAEYQRMANEDKTPGTSRKPSSK